MKRRFLFFIAVFFAAASAFWQSRGNPSLDETIESAALQIQADLGKGSTVIVYQFRTRNARPSNYILDELFDLLVNSKQFTVLDRGAQEVISAEYDFQFKTSSGMISDDSLMSLTRMIGAQAIITGTLDDAGDEYRFRLRVIGTETAAAIVSYVGRVDKNDRRITGFAGRESSGGQKIGTGALNILFGLGSYIEGDTSGGLAITSGWAVAAGLFAIEAAALDWDRPAVGVPATIGVCAAGITLVYGFARPFIYNRAPRLASAMDNTQVSIVPASGGGFGFQITHTIKF